jgi:hypothetical protein
MRKYCENSRQNLYWDTQANKDTAGQMISTEWIEGSPNKFCNTCPLADLQGI